MGSVIIVLLLLFAGAIVLVAEMYFPSFGILGLLAGVLFVIGIYQAYGISTPFGHASLIGTALLAPASAIFGIKTFHKTPFGRALSPPNPEHDNAFKDNQQALSKNIGQQGQAITPLRPVGACMINGQRVNCVAERGLIESGREVQVIGIKGCDLEVREIKPTTPG